MTFDDQIFSLKVGETFTFHVSSTDSEWDDFVEFLFESVEPLLSRRKITIEADFRSKTITLIRR